MLPGNSPFTNVGELKELPYTLDGSFAWLSKTKPHGGVGIGTSSKEGFRSQLASVIASAKKHGLSLPKEFVTFIRRPKLHGRIRSATECSLDVAESVLPFGDGYLVRFLADQQGCAFWYLYTNKDGSDHCVVSSCERFDGDEMEYEMDELKETDFQFWAESFEAFILRFWLENEILFAEYDSTPPPEVGQRFLELYSQ